MTDKTQPEALRLADWLDTHSNGQLDCKHKAAAELRRQHARIAELEAELEAVGAGGVQALSAAPAVPAGWVERWHGSGGKEFWEGWSILNAANREMIAHLGPDVDPDAVRDIVAAHNEALCGECAGTGGRWCPACAGATPPAEQAAPKAAQEEMDKEASNARLDIDSNSTEPEQQRDVACSLEVGQHVGNGEHQEASCRGSKDSELLKIAARNLKYFIAHAQFSSFADKQAALNCIDILAAPQQEAQEPGEIDRLRAALVYTAFALHNKPQYMLADGIALIDGDTVQVSRDGWKVQASINPLRQSAQPAPQPAPAPLSDDLVQKTWALLDELEKLRGADRYDEDWVALNKRDDELRAALGAQKDTP